MKPIQIHPLSALLGAAALGAVLLGTSAMQGVGPPAGNSQVNWKMASPGDIAEFFSHVSFVDLDDGQGGTARTLRFEGINVQIVNGLGATNGYPTDPSSTDPAVTATNGVGNLILGYNELGNPAGDDRTGSHNLAVGHQVTFSSFGGQSVGHQNRITAAYAAVSGGANNEAGGQFASVSGGTSGTASGFAASISGGNAGIASGQQASITGGQLNTASGLRSCVHGGGSNQALAEESSILGGGHAWLQSEGNITNGIRSCIVGGSANQTAGAAHTSVVGGGFGRQTTGSYDWTACSLYEND